jgi:hypothetical protein
VVLLPSASGDGAERALQSIPGVSIGLLSTAQGSYTPARMLRDIYFAARLAHGGGRRLTGGPGRLAVVSLAADRSGYARLRAVVKARRPGELVLALERASGPRAHELRWAGLAAGIGIGGAAAAARAGTLSSATTREAGLIAAVDVAPTLLAHLRLPIPASARGAPIRVGGALDGVALRSLQARLEVVYPRRLPALACLLGAWALWLAIASLPLPGAGRPFSGTARSTSAAARTARLRWAARAGALALLWTPVAVLLPAALQPSAGAEYALIAGAAFALGALTDALLPWPRAPIAPALAAVAAVSIDALAGSQLLMRSLLGPNPAYGSRFYGIGNELKPVLAVLVFAAVAGALYPNPIPTRLRRRLADRRSLRSPIGGDPAACSQSGIDRRSAAAMAGAGTLLAAVEGSARIGAGVGGTILVCVGATVATLLLLPERSGRGHAIAALVGAPALGLALLAALDLATAHGAGHFTGSILQARSAADVQDLIVRRYDGAWRELRNGLMPLATAAALLLLALAAVRRERVLAPVASDPAWQAAFAGGAAGGVAGALIEDSGPVLLLVAVFALACVLGYLWGRPEPAHRLPSIGCVSVARWRRPRRRAAFAPGCTRTGSPG